VPKLYEYFGIIILFYANEHVPVHVHGKYQGRESKAELILENGELIEIRIAPVKNKRPLDAKQLKDFETFVRHYAKDIVQKWIEFFVYNRVIQSETITRRIKND
jgi:hypothetical protein